MQGKVLKVHPSDNVIVALSDMRQGEEISWNGRAIKLQHGVPAKHKFTEEDIPAGGQVRMYGVVVGTAISAIPAGGPITTQNVKHAASEFGGKAGSYQWKSPDISRWKDRTFMGYHRSDGQVGTTNHWIVIPMVFCENRNVDILREAFEEALGFRQPDPLQSYVRQLVNDYTGEHRPGNNLPPSTSRVFPNVDGIKFLNHEGGCGGTRQDSEALCALFAGYLHNPNVGGGTILSLGCQNAQVSVLKEKLHKLNPSFDKPLVILEQQQEGTERELLQKAIQQTFEGLKQINQLKRAPAPLSKLVLGLECGGSDGFSGITANPAIGHTSDLLAALGGTSILSEFPELCGVEQELINRCVDDKTANRFSTLMKQYAAAAKASGSGFDMNPSPGNIKDGLITDAMKSAGAAKKGGTSPVADVLDYTEYIRRAGLNLLCTPGNDVESTTAMAASGANIMLFTTGLGTPTGNPVVPVVKVSSNTTVARKMPDIIDIDCGEIVSGAKSIDVKGAEILDYLIDVASGVAQPCAVRLGQNDFIPWKRGVSL